jgi:hypothetical protein
VKGAPGRSAARSGPGSLPAARSSSREIALVTLAALEPAPLN